MREGVSSSVRLSPPVAGLAPQPASLDLLDILDLLDFVFDFFYGSKSGAQIEDRYPGGGRWPLAGFWGL